MLIEIRKAGFVNKGAELMLYAAMVKIKKAYPEAYLVMSPTADNGPAPYVKRAQLGFLQKASFSRFGVHFGDLAVLAPKKLREAYGVVLDKEIDVVLDAAGFNYSDQTGVNSVKALADECKRWRRRGQKVVLLPQAMGPFRTPKNKKYIKIVADNVDLMFPRDPISYQYLTEIVGERPNIKIAPDFTNLLKGIVPDYFNPHNCRYCIVPNYQMIKKTTEDQRKSYIPFMISCAKYLLDKDMKPFILVHEGVNDLKLAQQVADGVGNLPIIQETHPLKIKGILGACQGSISSRFHGLVSALSQGVPSLATGWSHKYEMLFKEYGFDSGMLDLRDTKETVQKKIDLITNPESRANIQLMLREKTQQIKELSLKMWDLVFEVLK